MGPRPPMAAEVEQYDLAHLRRLDVLPGITGRVVEARQDPSFDATSRSIRPMGELET